MTIYINKNNLESQFPLKLWLLKVKFNNGGQDRICQNLLKIWFKYLTAYLNHILLPI